MTRVLGILSADLPAWLVMDASVCVPPKSLQGLDQVERLFVWPQEWGGIFFSRKVDHADGQRAQNTHEDENQAAGRR